MTKQDKNELKKKISVNQAIRRLKAYEESGLTPYQLFELQQTVENQKKKN